MARRKRRKGNDKLINYLIFFLVIAVVMLAWAYLNGKDRPGSPHIADNDLEKDVVHILDRSFETHNYTFTLVNMFDIDKHCTINMTVSQDGEILSYNEGQLEPLGPGERRRESIEVTGIPQGDSSFHLDMGCD